jgi:hypothetical protein
MEGQEQPPPPPSAYASHLASLIEKRTADVQIAVKAAIVAVKAAIVDAPVPTDAQRTEFLRAMEHVVERDIQRWDPMYLDHSMSSVLEMADEDRNSLLSPKPGLDRTHTTVWWRAVVKWNKGCTPSVNSTTIAAWQRSAIRKLYNENVERVLNTVLDIWRTANPDLEITRKDDAGSFRIRWKPK